MNFRTGLFLWTGNYLIRQAFPEWENRVIYWDVHDLDWAPPDQALAEIEQLVRGIVADLGATPNARDPNSGSTKGA